MSQSNAEADAYAVPHKGMITLSIMLATIMQTLDTTIANVALPNMRGSLSATAEQASWVLTSYIVAAAVVTPLIGFVAERWGRKNIFAVSVIGFTVSSMACGAATSIGQMVIYRLAQGVFGASLVPLAQSVLLDINPREKHASAMAMWGLGVMLGPIIGPTLGGYLTDYYSWRWVFYINVPVGVVAALGIIAFVPETERRKRSFDVFGFSLLAIAIACLQLMLDRGETKDWFSSVEIQIETGLCILTFYMFLVHIFTARAPFLEPKLFKDRNLSVGLAMIFMVGVILLATLALLPPFLQNLSGYPVILAGLVLAPRGLGTMIAMSMAGRLSGRVVDPRALIILGLLITALSLHEMASFTADVSAMTVALTGVTQGLGLGFIFVPLSSTTFSTLSPAERTEGTAMYSLMRNIGSSIGISVVVTLLAQNTQRYHSALAEFITPYAFLFRNHALPTSLDVSTAAGAGTLNNMINGQASLLGYLADFKMMMWLSLASIVLVLMLRPPKSGKSSHAEVVME